MSRQRELHYSEVLRRRQFKLEAKIYLLYGPEDFLKREALDKFVAQIENKDFNLDVLDGETATAEEILSSAYTLPLLADKRLVVVKDAQKLKSVEQVKLAKGLPKVGSAACLVFVAGERKGFGDRVIIGKELDERIKELGAMINFPALRPRDLGNWVRVKLKNLGKEIDEDALRYLVDLVGGDLTRLNNELEKLVNFDPGAKSIDKEVIREVVSRTPEVRIFDLVDALGGREAERALGILLDLLKEGESPTMILGMILRQFKLVWQTKVLVDAGYLPQKIREVPQEILCMFPQNPNAVQFLQGRSYFIPRFMAQAHNFSYEQLKAALGRLSRSDLAMKDIEGEPRDASTNIQLLINDLCSI